MTTGYDSPLSGPTTSRPEIPDGYYAVPDPSNADVMTAWQSVNGHLKPTPAKAQYGPVLYKRDVPPGRGVLDRQRFIREWFDTVRRPWTDAVRAAIVADVEGAGMRYAQTAIRCRDCGRSLTDPISRAAGRGPDCRAQLAEAIAAAAKYGGAA